MNEWYICIHQRVVLNPTLVKITLSFTSLVTTPPVIGEMLVEVIIYHAICMNFITHFLQLSVTFCFTSQEHMYAVIVLHINLYTEISVLSTRCIPLHFIASVQTG